MATFFIYSNFTEIESHTDLFNKLGDRLPKALKERQAALLEAVKTGF
jgi:phosphoenolpyruvate carboxykinase (GTP)